MMFYRNM